MHVNYPIPNELLHEPAQAPVYSFVPEYTAVPVPKASFIFSEPIKILVKNTTYTSQRVFLFDIDTERIFKEGVEITLVKNPYCTYPELLKHIGKLDSAIQIGQVSIEKISGTSRDWINHINISWSDKNSFDYSRSIPVGQFRDPHSFIDAVQIQERQHLFAVQNIFSLSVNNIPAGSTFEFTFYPVVISPLGEVRFNQLDGWTSADESEFMNVINPVPASFPGNTRSRSPLFEHIVVGAHQTGKTRITPPALLHPGQVIRFHKQLDSVVAPKPTPVPTMSEKLRQAQLDVLKFELEMEIQRIQKINSSFKSIE